LLHAAASYDLMKASCRLHGSSSRFLASLQRTLLCLAAVTAFEFCDDAGCMLPANAACGRMFLVTRGQHAAAACEEGYHEL
jgi:hypothetical protein